MTNAEGSKTARTYNSASDSYDDPANSFWERFGKRTVDRLGLREGMRVLDVCGGSGASAEDLLALARGKAVSRGLEQAEFRTANLLNLEALPTDFDAVVWIMSVTKKTPNTVCSRR